MSAVPKQPAQADATTNPQRVDPAATIINVSKAAHYRSTEWGNQPIALRALLDWVSELHVGKKSSGEVWAPATLDGPRRLATKVLGTDLIVFDSDAGHPLPQIKAQVEQLGWYARIIPSSSWNTTETDTSADKFDAWVSGQADTEAADLTERYLVEEEHKTPAVAKGAEILKRFPDPKDGKNRILFKHQPCEKYRIICVLSERYDLSTPEKRKDWKKYYNAAADQIGLPFDSKCASPERLFYLSYLAPDRLKLAHDHQAEVQGGPINLAALPMPEQPDTGQTTVVRLAPLSHGDREKQKAKGKKQEESPLHRLNEIAVTPDNLELWVPVLFPKAKFQEGTGAWRVKPADLGQDYEEDLSIAPTGIREFGPGTSQTPVGLVIEYGEAVGIVGEAEDEKGKAAAKWLAETIGKSWPRDFQDGLKIGSDVEIAGKVAEQLRRDHDGRVVAAEGKIYRYDGRRWSPIPDRELRLLVHKYDGTEYRTVTGKPEQVKLSSGKINSILNELTTVLKTDEAFFAKPAAGINALNGLIRIVGEGKSARDEVVAHDPDHRCRHVIQGEYHPEQNRLADILLEETLLGTLLNGSFEGESDATDKWSLLAEVAGVAAAGAAPLMGEEQKAVILLGEHAQNGKSQFLDLMRGLLPAEAVCSIPPEEFQDEKNRISLAGKLLNATDEISSANAISANVFKAIITCNRVQGRDLYKSSVDFQPQALHVLATNGLPSFKGGMDPGVKRRLMVVPFNRVIPKEERIPNLGKRIAHGEMDLLLAWAVYGLLRVARNGWQFTELTASKDQIEDWLENVCPVTSWLKSGDVVFETPVVDGRERPVTTKQAYRWYQEWERGENLRRDQSIGRKAFTSRVKTSGLGPIHHRTNTGPVFLNLSRAHSEQDNVINLYEDRKVGG
jgi:P4 family phage/plasmid primase-like protien